MGFGLLFFACFLTYFGALTPIGAFTYVAGVALMLYALYKLANQNKWFFASMISSLVLLVNSVIVVVMYVLGSTGDLYKVIVSAQTIIAPIVLILIMIAVLCIAKEVELRKIQGWSIVNTGFIAIYCICNLVSFFVTSAAVIQRLGLVCLICQILYSAFALIIIFNCYAKICYEDDKEMQSSNTGMPVFDFLNKLFNKATDKNRKNGPRDKEEK